MGKLKKLKDALDTAKKIRVYHGSPYKFDKFDIFNIGTGEGAQAYGRGHYFAENRRIAQGYKNKLSGPDRGSLYTVEIPDTDYLLWDKPLSQQPESVRAKLIAGVIKETEPSDAKWLATINGEAVNGFQTKKAAQAWLDNESAGKIYESLELTKSKNGAANYLKENGIPGIKYLDGSSRNAGEGSYNYVVFNDEDINILERGKIDPRLLAPLAVGSGAAVAAQMAYDDEAGDFSKATRAYQDFMQRRQQKKPVWESLRQGGEALRAVVQGMGAGIVSDAYRLGGYLSPQPVQDTEAQAQTIMNRLAYVPQDQNPIIEEMGQQLDQFGQDVRPLVNAFQQTPIYKAYEMLPERAQGVVNVLSNYAF